MPKREGKKDDRECEGGRREMQGRGEERKIRYSPSLSPPPPLFTPLILRLPSLSHRSRCCCNVPVFNFLQNSHTLLICVCFLNIYNPSYLPQISPYPMWTLKDRHMNDTLLWKKQGFPNRPGRNDDTALIQKLQVFYHAKALVCLKKEASFGIM